MKKIIIKSIIFLLILFVILLMISRVFVPKNNTQDAGILNQELRMVGVLAEPENSLDVIVIGDSEAYTSYIPLEAWNDYAYASYVSGGPKQKLTDLDGLLQQILDRQNPEIVLLETNIIYREISLSEAISQPVKEGLPIFDNHNRWKSLNLNDFCGEIEYSRMQVDKGFYFNTEKKACKNPNKNYMKNTTKSKEIPKINELYFKKIKKQCDLIDAELILYSCPSPKNWNMNKHNGIEKLANEMNLEYIDLNLLQEQIQIDWTNDTRDSGDHLNYTGALKTTKFLAKYLSEKDLPNHQEDSKYNSWKTLYQAYKGKTIVNEIKTN